MKYGVFERRGKEKHEKTLQDAIQESQNLGNRVIDLAGKSPDAIEVFIKDGIIIMNCIEVMSAKTKSKTWRMNQHIRMKKELYQNLGFDEVKIITYNPDS